MNQKPCEAPAAIIPRPYFCPRWVTFIVNGATASSNEPTLEEEWVRFWCIWSFDSYITREKPAAASPRFTCDFVLSCFNSPTHILVVFALSCNDRKDVPALQPPSVCGSLFGFDEWGFFRKCSLNSWVRYSDATHKAVWDQKLSGNISAWTFYKWIKSLNDNKSKVLAS